MSGAPGEIWRKFRFVSVPGWAFAFFALLCTGIGLLPIFIILAVVSRRATGYLPLTRGSRQHLLLATWLPFSLIPFAFALWIAAAIIGASSGSTSVQPRDTLVYATWVADSRVTNGPEPGYKPAFSGLSGYDISSATASMDTTGTSWVVDVSFTSSGAATFAQLTRDNVAACPGDPNTVASANCAERHLGIWIGLNQNDIDHWTDSTYVEVVTQPWTPSAGTSDPRPKFVTDPITLEPITGGTAQIGGAYTQAEAQRMAADIAPVASTSTSTNRVASGIAVVLLVLGFLAIVAGLVGLVIVRAIVGPRGKVMERQPNQPDTLIELRNVHPGFVIAVEQHQLTRAAQYAAAQQSPLLPGPS